MTAGTAGTARTYDSKCYDLAEHFAQDEHLSKEQLHELACNIQETVESYFEALEMEREHNREPPEPDGECYRGGEYAASVAHEMAEARKVK